MKNEVNCIIVFLWVCVLVYICTCFPFHLFLCCTSSISMIFSDLVKNVITRPLWFQCIFNSTVCLSRMPQDIQRHGGCNFWGLFYYFVLCLTYSLLFYSLHHVDMPSIQPVTTVNICITSNVVVDNWLLVWTKGQMSTITWHLTSIHIFLTSSVLGTYACFSD